MTDETAPEPDLLDRIDERIEAARKALARVDDLSPITVDRTPIFATVASAEANIAAAESLRELVVVMREFVTALTAPAEPGDTTS